MLAPLKDLYSQFGKWLAKSLLRSTPLTRSLADSSRHRALRGAPLRSGERARDAPQLEARSPTPPGLGRWEGGGTGTLKLTRGSSTLPGLGRF